MNPTFLHNLKEHCRALIKNSSCGKMPFHNWQHTLNVVAHIKEIGRAENVDQDETELLLIAAYFHDVGQINGAEGHEQMSCQYAKSFLENHNYPQSAIAKIQDIILATHMPQNPVTTLQKIICDADLAHLGELTFECRSNCLREEWSLTHFKDFTEREWLELNIKFLECHHFHTLYAQNKFSEQKEKNLNVLKERLDQMASGS